MQIGNFYFGAEDARNIDLSTDDDKRRFIDSYVVPSRFRLEDFYEGRKYFVYGPKGAGKSALLHYIRLHAEDELNAVTTTYHFQSSFSPSELSVFNKKHEARLKEGVDILLDDLGSFGSDGISVYWRLVFFVEIARLFKRRKYDEGPALDFRKTIEAAKLISQSKNVAKKYPEIEKFQLKISKDPSIQLEGKFSDAQVEDLDSYLSHAEDLLEEVYLENSPVMLFVDEMEISRRGDKSDEIRLHAVASLVRSIRDFNERFKKTDIRVIAAVRDEVVNEVATVQGEVYRIVRDRGLKVEWPNTIRGRRFHPLFEICLRWLLVQDTELHPYGMPTDYKELDRVRQKYFPNMYQQSATILNHTWYRPRDVALLFEVAANIDEHQTKFRKRTLEVDVVPELGKRMWQDSVSGLSVKYSPAELAGIERVLRGGADVYDRETFFARCDELSHDYEDVALLSDTRWLDVLADLYAAGVIFAQSKGTGKKNFSFRGDKMPSLTGQFEIGIHRTLYNELSINI